MCLESPITIFLPVLFLKNNKMEPISSGADIDRIIIPSNTIDGFTWLGFWSKAEARGTPITPGVKIPIKDNATQNPEKIQEIKATIFKSNFLSIFGTSGVVLGLSLISLAA